MSKKFKNNWEYPIFLLGIYWERFTEKSVICKNLTFR